MMLDATDPGRVEAVFDWDMCTLGDPLCDLGTLLAAGWKPARAERRQRPAHAVERARLPDPPRSGRALRHSAAASTSSTVPYYYVFGLFKIAVVLQQIYYRYHVGQTKDARFANFEQVAEMLFNLAAEPHRPSAARDFASRGSCCRTSRARDAPRADLAGSAR